MEKLISYVLLIFFIHSTVMAQDDFEDIFFGPEYEITKFDKTANLFNSDKIDQIINPQSFDVYSYHFNYLSTTKQLLLLYEIESSARITLSACPDLNPLCISKEENFFHERIQKSLSNVITDRSLILRQNSLIDLSKVLNIIKGDKRQQKNSFLFHQFINEKFKDGLKNTSYYLDGAGTLPEFTSNRALSYPELIETHEAISSFTYFGHMHLHMSSDSWVDLISNTKAVDEYNRVKYIRTNENRLNNEPALISSLNTGQLERGNSISNNWRAIFTPYDKRGMTRVIVWTEENIDGSSNRIEDRTILEEYQRTIPIETLNQSIKDANSVLKKVSNNRDIEYIRSIYRKIYPSRFFYKNFWSDLRLYHDFLIYGGSPHYAFILDELLDNNKIRKDFLDAFQNFTSQKLNYYHQENFLIRLKVLTFMKESKHSDLRAQALIQLKGINLAKSILSYQPHKIPFHSNSSHKIDQANFLVSSTKEVVDDFLKAFKNNFEAKKIIYQWHEVFSHKIKDDPEFKASFTRIFSDIDKKKPMMIFKGQALIKQLEERAQANPINNTSKGKVNFFQKCIRWLTAR